MSREPDAAARLPDQDVPEGEYEFTLPAETPLQRWLFFEASRWWLVGVALLGVFVTFAGFGWADLVTFRNESPAALLLSVFIAGNFTLIAVVITINQLVLSREFGKPHSLRERNEGILSLREDVRDVTGRVVAPADPLSFVQVIVARIEEEAERVRSGASAAGTAAVRDDLETYADAVDEETGRLRENLSDARFGEFRVLTALLFYRIAWQLHATQRLRRRHGDALDGETAAALARTQELLHLLNVSRQYLQTVYMQRELAELSRLLLFVGVPSILAAALAMLVYTGESGLTIPGRLLLPVFSGAAALSFAPLALLLAYVVRVSTIVSRMPMLNPFLTDG